MKEKIQARFVPNHKHISLYIKYIAIRLPTIDYYSFNSETKFQFSHRHKKRNRV
jgi:hypothetical protein